MRLFNYYFSIQTPSEFSKLLRKGNLSVDQYFQKIEQPPVIVPITLLFSTVIYW